MLASSRDAAGIVDVLLTVVSLRGVSCAIVLGGGRAGSRRPILQHAVERAQVMGNQHVMQRGKGLRAEQSQRGHDQKHVAHGLSEP